MSNDPNRENEQVTPPQQTEEEIEQTIDQESEVDEASLESFPASDPPASTGSHARTVNPAQEREEARSGGDEDSA